MDVTGLLRFVFKGLDSELYICCDGFSFFSTVTSASVIFCHWYRSVFIITVGYCIGVVVIVFIGWKLVCVTRLGTHNRGQQLKRLCCFWWAWYGERACCLKYNLTRLRCVIFGEICVPNGTLLPKCTTFDHRPWSNTTIYIMEKGGVGTYIISALFRTGPITKRNLVSWK